MSRADETTAQPAETPDEAQSISETTPLPRRFLATASGPVTRITDHGDETTERVRAEISIEHSIETLEEFATFWDFRDLRSWKQAALEHVSPPDRSKRLPRAGRARRNLECRSCGETTRHTFGGFDEVPVPEIPDTPIWECTRCQSLRHGPDPDSPRGGTHHR